jgi:DNA polymerase-1
MYQLITDEQEFHASLPKLTGTLYVDTETTGLDPHTYTLLLVQIATDTDVYVYDFTRLPLELVRLFAPMLGGEQLKVLQNASFDIKVFYKFGRFVMRNIHDTRIVEAMLTAGQLGVQNNLAAIADRRLGLTLDKTVRDQFTNGFTEITAEQLEYAAKDVIVLQQLYPIHQILIADAEIEKVYKLESDLIPVVAMMEYYGMPFKKEHLSGLEPVLQVLIDNAEKAVQRMVIENGAADQVVFSRDGYKALNSSSNQQMLKYFNDVGINVTDLNARTITEWDFKHRKSAERYEMDSALFDDDLLESIDAFGRYENFQLRMYAYLVGARKLQSTYVKGLQEMENPVTKRIHCTFNQIGAATGRFSSSRPNLQNLPSDQKMRNLGVNESIRRAFAVNDNRRLIIADYSTIELVIIADASNDAALVANLGDLHTYVAKHVLGVTEINDTNKKEHPYKIWRDVAKMVNYSIAYSVGGDSLAKQMTIQLGPLGVKYTPKQGDEIIEQWKQMFPEATAWLKKSARSAVLFGWVADSYGRKRWWNRAEFHQRWKKEAAEREAMNFPIQGLSATMVKLALIKAFDRLDLRQAVIVSTVHDEIILESTVGYAEIASTILKGAMEEAAQEVLPNLGHTVKVDPAISTKYDK